MRIIEVKTGGSLSELHVLISIPDFDGSALALVRLHIQESEYVIGGGDQTQASGRALG